MSEEIDTQPNMVQKPAKRKRTGLWIVLGLLVAVVVPVLGCGAFGIAIAASGTSATQTTFGPAVGVIRVEGVITSQPGAGFATGVAYSENIIEQLEQASADSDIKAIVLRINSPGGEVVASDEIHHALIQFDKPIVVSMGSLAASGGYYIAAPADYIYATPHTFTGSIGVISQIITAEELLDDLGVEVVIVTSGDMKDFGSLSQDMTAEELAYWQGLIDEAHAGFVDIVAEGRGLDLQTVEQLANGSVYTGLQAVDNGLVDEIGYYEDAISRAAVLGGISGEYDVIDLVVQPSLMEILYGYRVPISPYEVVEDALHSIASPSLEYRYLGPAN